MKTTLGAIAVAFSLIAGVGAASAAPNVDVVSNYETVFEGK